VDFHPGAVATWPLKRQGAAHQCVVAPHNQPHIKMTINKYLTQVLQDSLHTTGLSLLFGKLASQPLFGVQEGLTFSRIHANTRILWTHPPTPTHTYTHVYTNTHTHTHARTHARTCARAVRLQTHTVFKNVVALSRFHAFTLSRFHAFTLLSCTHKRTHVHTHTFCTRTRARKCTHMRPH
jgi:hypothetical protein